ncbi:META domain-containing protein [Draconibacterium sp. IB214405]|uniref:META domain-containing protein n=1 Tax=Draconibacterium sp. IB214405 TaxID=3097352 RepID=UPI002A103CE6|nr:META domain-containing protein [Draconibacterium sp. IB214405]MDX8337905.1 META domain-containing protein [Draconibacterium sp. IB214405]
MKNTWIVGIILLLFACNSKDTATIFWVNSYRVDCVGVGPMKCMLIQKGEVLDDGAWQNFYSKIEGFDYEPGYIYKLKVQEEQLENVPADASSIKYTLVEVLEKKEDGKLALNGNWEALKINGSVIKLPRMRGAGVLPTLQIDIFERQISGIDNCNNFTGTINKIGESSLEFGTIAGTQKMCPDMSISKAFNEALSAVKKYQLTDNTLLLLDEAGNELLEFNRGTEAKVLLNDIWVAEIVDGTLVADASTAPSLEINSSEMKAMGSDGCNNFTGKILNLTNSELTFGPLAGTRKMCPDMNIPDKFNKAISQVRSYKIASLKLSLLDEKGTVLVVMKKVD